MNTKTALIAGATGLTGSELINNLLENNNYKKVIVFSRRPLNINHEKLEIIVQPFEEILNYQPETKIDDCFCTLGTTQKKSGKEGLFKVDYEYVSMLAQFCKLNAITRFLVVSSQGANPQSPFFYMKTKGMMEEKVKSVQIPTTYILRPSLIVGKRVEYRPAEAIGYWIYKLFTPLMVGKFRKVRPIKASVIAKCMINMAQKEQTGFHTLESDIIQIYGI